MGKKSHRVLEIHIGTVESARQLKSLTHKAISERLGCTRQPISKFFNGNPVSCELFIGVCQILDLDWQEISGIHKSVVGNGNLTESKDNIEQQSQINRNTQMDSGNYNEDIQGNYYHIAGNYYNQPAQLTSRSEATPPLDINTLVNQLREQVKADIETRCGTMRILDMSQPIGLDDIYTKVNILEKISGRRRKDIADLIDNCDSENFNRFNYGQVKEKIPGKAAKLAWSTFSQGEYFFKQDKAERYIGEYIRNLPGANTDEEALRLNSEAVLKSIESQHGLLVERAKGIYSFSHLTFQEYFATREIIVVQQSSDEALGELLNHLLEPRWREVFLLAVEMSSNASSFLLKMKIKADLLLAEDEELQNFLLWVYSKSISDELQNYNYLMIKVFYFCRHLIYDFKIFEPIEDVIELADFFEIDYNYTPLGIELLDLESEFYRLFKLSESVSFAPSNSLLKELEWIIKSDYLNILDTKIRQELLEINKIALKLSDFKININAKIETDETFKNFENAWLKVRPLVQHKILAIMKKYFNILYDWNLDNIQLEKLENYYLANLRLFQCLNSECYVNSEVRQEIEETLLLPIAEIEKRKSKLSS